MKRVFKIALLAGVVAAVVKLVSTKKAEWEGLTESDVRAKIDSRLPEKVPPNTRAALADKVVDKMRQRGALTDESATAAPSD